MMKDLSLEDFLLRNNISSDEWNTSALDWGLIHSIGIDHESRMDELQESAEFYAKLIQKCSKVHSVRWRVKDAEHLMEKIFRKITSADSKEKYKDISLENYHEVITDLIGVRALHLFKDDCFEIDTYLRRNWNTVETPVAYIRNGDHDSLRGSYTENGFDIKEHPAGYRSIHYVFESQPVKRKIMAEVQVRTIFEEGWSEIDHKIRYPNFSNDQLVSYFLTIFNRLAGSADEMGGFVKELTCVLAGYDVERKAATQERKKNINQIEELLSNLENVKKEDEESKKLINMLKSELSNLKSNSAQELKLAGSDYSPSLNKYLDYLARRQLLAASNTTRTLTASESLLKTLENINKLKGS